MAPPLFPFGDKTVNLGQADSRVLLSGQPAVRFKISLKPCNLSGVPVR